jgi:outer membrane protein OmpA-like peptidoglycan-associated protein
LSRIEFLGANTVVPTEAEAVLTKIAALVANTDRRLQLNAYAGGTPETVSAARRLSLSRALAVRSFLIEAGVRSTRIDVRALGLADDDGPPERVDILLLGL